MSVLRWVNDAELQDEPSLLNAKLPSGITLADLCAAATDYLWRASGARYGARQLTIRPSRLVPSCACSSGLLDPTTGHGRSVYDDCSCGTNEVHLEGPATDITVIVDGVTLADSDWVLVDGYRLIRVGRFWPCCQNLSTPNGDVGTWSIAYTVGPAPPPLGRLAARELVIQLALYHSGKDSKLPKGTTNVTRAGITVDIKRPQRSNGADPGTTGLPTVELFLDSVNPKRLRRGPLVLSPDTLVGV